MTQHGQNSYLFNISLCPWSLENFQMNHTFEFHKDKIFAFFLTYNIMIHILKDKHTKTNKYYT